MTLKHTLNTPNNPRNQFLVFKPALSLPLLASLTNQDDFHASLLSSSHLLERLHPRLFHNLEFISVPHFLCFWPVEDTLKHTRKGREKIQHLQYELRKEI